MNEEWAKAFVKAQGELPEITKDKTVTVKTKTGQTFKYSYADLPTIVAKVRPVLSKNGLAVAQDVEIQEGRVVVTTRIYHVSGHMETFGPVVLHGGNDAQAAGSAITYARRYALCAALNIAADEDDDGQINKNSAGPHPSASQLKSPTAPPNHSGGEADGPGHTPDKAAESPASSPEQVSEGPVVGEVAGSSGNQTQRSGGAPQQADLGSDPTEGKTGVPPAAESWTAIHAAVGRGDVKQVKVHMTAAHLCTARDGVPVPTSYEDVKECPPDVLAEIVKELNLAVAA